MDTINITCARGDTARFVLSALLDDAPIDLTGGSVLLAARYSPADDVLFELAVGSGITLRNQTDEPGKADIKMRSTDTLQLPNSPVDLFYSIHVITAANEEYCICRGTLAVAPIAWDGTP